MAVQNPSVFIIFHDLSVVLNHHAFNITTRSSPSREMALIMFRIIISLNT